MKNDGRNFRKRGLNSPITPEELLPPEYLPATGAPTERQLVVRTAILKAIRTFIAEPKQKAEIMRRAKMILDHEDGK